jgi:hypothetical protein
MARVTARWSISSHRVRIEEDAVSPEDAAVATTSAVLARHEWTRIRCNSDEDRAERSQRIGARRRACEKLHPIRPNARQPLASSPRESRRAARK